MRLLPSLLFALLPGWSWAVSGRIAVGLELTLDYGVASVYHSDGTLTDVAKIRGSQAYRHVMRTPSTQSFNTSNDSGRGMTADHDEDTKALITMIKALKTSVELCLQQSVTIAGASLPFDISTSFRTKLRAAALDQLVVVFKIPAEPAGFAAARAYGAFSQCSHSQSQPESRRCYAPRLVLTLEYSHASLDATIILDQNETPIVRKTLHEPSLGADGVQAKCRQGNSETCLDRLTWVLSNFMQLPADDDPRFPMIGIYSELVIHGEAADNTILNKVLRDILRDQYELLSAAASRRSNEVTPLFAASRGTAEFVFNSSVGLAQHVELR